MDVLFIPIILFRRFGAIFALQCGGPAKLIKLQGDWCSNAYQRYINPFSPIQDPSSIYIRANFSYPAVIDQVKTRNGRNYSSIGVLCEHISVPVFIMSFMSLCIYINVNLYYIIHIVCCLVYFSYYFYLGLEFGEHYFNDFASAIMD